MTASGVQFLNHEVEMGKCNVLTELLAYVS